MTIEMSQEEVDMLHELVERRIAELGPEIHHTHSRRYRELLRRLREALAGLELRLVPAAAGSAEN